MGNRMTRLGISGTEAASTLFTSLRRQVQQSTDSRDAFPGFGMSPDDMAAMASVLARWKRDQARLAELEKAEKAKKEKAENEKKAQADQSKLSNKPISEQIKILRERTSALEFHMTRIAGMVGEYWEVFKRRICSNSIGRLFSRMKIAMDILKNIEGRFRVLKTRLEDLENASMLQSMTAMGGLLGDPGANPNVGGVPLPGADAGAMPNPSPIPGGMPADASQAEASRMGPPGEMPDANKPGDLPGENKYSSEAEYIDQIAGEKDMRLINLTSDRLMKQMKGDLNLMMVKEGLIKKLEKMRSSAGTNPDAKNAVVALERLLERIEKGLDISEALLGEMAGNLPTADALIKAEQDANPQSEGNTEGPSNVESEGTSESARPAELTTSDSFSGERTENSSVSQGDSAKAGPKGAEALLEARLDNFDKLDVKFKELDEFLREVRKKADKAMKKPDAPPPAGNLASGTVGRSTMPEERAPQEPDFQVSNPVLPVPEPTPRV